MPFVTTREMLGRAREGKYAVGAFNFENMEMAIAILSAAEELRAPVILQTTPSTVKYAGFGVFRALAQELAENARVPVALHYDHGDSFESAVSAIQAGYTSVMIDGSNSSLEENIELTRRVVKRAAAAGIPVEAELGRVGGKEDDYDGGDGGYTDPEDAARFVSETGISSLAAAIGTAHGIYSGTPVLDVARLREISRRLSAAGLGIPLVLHGASGLSESAVRECIAEGICKVNFATELRQAYTAGVRSVLSGDDEVYDPKKYGKTAMANVKEIVASRIIICGGEGKA